MPGRGGPGAPAGTGASGNIDDRRRDLHNRDCDAALINCGDDEVWFRARPARRYRLRTDASGEIILVRKPSPEFFLRLSIASPLVDIDDAQVSIEKLWWREAFANTDVDLRFREQAVRAARRRAP
jgi:hypothetical protein